MAIDLKLKAGDIPVWFKELASPDSLNSSSTSLIVALTSHGGSGIKFEYSEALVQYDKAHMLFLSSEYRNGYYIEQGLNDDYPDLASVFNIIDNIVLDYNITHLVFVGEGSGGTGAIYYGWECARQPAGSNIANQDTKTSIIAFAPYKTLPGAVWDLVNDVCIVDPVPIGLLANSSHIYTDETYYVKQAGKKINYDNEHNRWQGLDTYLTVVDQEGYSHLGKAAYIHGWLFNYFDAAINPADAAKTPTNPWNNIFPHNTWSVNRLKLHREEMDAGMTDADLPIDEDVKAITPSS